VTITETLEKVVEVEAFCPEEAGAIVKMNYHNEDPILSADDFTGVTFSAQEKENMLEGQTSNMKYEFTFTETHYGTVEIESSTKPTKDDVVRAITKGDAYYKDTEYKDIRLCGSNPQRSKPVQDRSR